MFSRSSHGSLIEVINIEVFIRATSCIKGKTSRTGAYVKKYAYQSYEENTGKGEEIQI